jgi:hypothetical protein
MGGTRVTAVLCGLGTIAVMGSCAPGMINGMSPNFLRCEQSSSPPATGFMPANAELRLEVQPGHVLVIPAGGAAAGTNFTMRAIPGTMVRVVLAPSGQLLQPATLTLSYQNCEAVGDPADYRIWRQRRPGDAGPPWSRVGGTPGRGQQSISVSLDSLSTYSLAAN